MLRPYQFLGTPKGRLLLLGDVIAIGVVTLLGFATHDTLGTAGARMLTTFLPWVTGWMLIAPWLGLYEDGVVAAQRELWRPFWAMCLTSPLAAFLRGWMIGRPSTQVFVLVMMGVAGVTMMLWRVVYMWRAGRHG